MAFHPTDQVVIDFHEHSILELAIFLGASMQLNFAVEAAYLLDLCGYEITFDIKVTDLKLIFLNTSSLHTTWKVNG